jgi:flagellar M-ring protein FliF
VAGTGNASGVPGVPAAGPQAQISSPERSRQSEVTNYEVSKMVRHTVQPKGTVRRLSVAVILDNKTIQTLGPDGKVTTTNQKLSPQDLEAYRTLVYAAVGYSKERGDTVTLENVPFFNEIRPKDEITVIPWHVRWQSYLLPAIRYTSFILLFLFVYLLLFRPMKKRVFQTFEGIAAPQLAGQGLPEISGEASAKALSAPAHTEETAALESAAAAISEERQVASGEQPPDLHALDEQIERDFLREAQMLGMGGRKYAVLRRKLSEKAQKEPEMVSQLVRSWIQER